MPVQKCDSGVVTVRHSGVQLAEHRWLAARVAESAGSWRTEDERVAGTLWWYTASSVLFGTSLQAWALDGSLRHPALEHLSFTLGTGGVPADLRSDWDCTDLDELGDAWRATLTAVIEGLAGAGGLRTRPLWAIASDSLANRSLDAGAGAGSARRGADFAVELAARIGPELPRPRFVEVSSRLFCRRSSCCLIYLTGQSGKCISCPRRDPEERRALWRTQPG